MSTNRSCGRCGFSLIESLIAVSVLGIVVVVFGSAVTFVHAAYETSQQKSQATFLAVETMEIVDAIKNEVFACRCAVHECDGSLCVRPSDHQSCFLGPRPEGCWTAYPVGHTSEGPYHLEKTDFTWALRERGETVTLDSHEFTRTITIQNVFRDSDTGDIAESGTLDTNTKRVTAVVFWRGPSDSSIAVSRLITDWK